MSLSQSSIIPTLAGGYISNEMIQSKISITSRQCKIIGTIGPACWSLEQLQLLMDSGMNTALLNMSHNVPLTGGNYTHFTTIMERIRCAADNVHRNIAIWMDLMGPELRTGKFANGVTEVELQKGNILVLVCTTPNFLGNDKQIACTYSKLPAIIKPGQQILIADGSLVLTVLGTDVSHGEVICRIENTTTLGETKKVCFPGLELTDLPTITSKDVDDVIQFGIPQQVDFISVSFVRSPEDILNLRQILNEHGGTKIKIIAKIDNIYGLQNFDAILHVSDGIVIARGDLGMCLPPQKIFLAQKMMIRECNIVGKPVIVATQLLESMIHNPRPTRAECSDVANAVLDGTDSFLLSGETAISPYYDKVVKVVARTICEAELSRNYNALYSAIQNSVLERYGPDQELSATESLASSAVKTAIDVKAKLIVVLSQSGVTARYIAKYRPGRFIVCLTTDPVVARQTSGILKGVHSYLVGSLEKDYIIAQETAREAIKAKIAEPGDLMVIVCGTIKKNPTDSSHPEASTSPTNTGSTATNIIYTNQVRVERIVEEDIDPAGGTTTRPRSNTLSKLHSFEVAYKDAE